MGSCCFKAANVSGSSKPKARMPPAPPTRPADDFAIIQQYSQLYMKVRTWSSEFLGGAKSSPKSPIPMDVQQLVQRVVLQGDMSRVLADKTLHRHVIEGLVGIAVSEMLTPSKIPPQTDPSIRKTADQLCNTVLKFATSKCSTKQLKADLVAILQMAVDLDRAFKTQSAAFVVVYARVVNRETPVVFADNMEDKSSGRDEKVGAGPRKVGIMIFPGVFKTSKSFRTCLVKIKVVCTDEMEKYVGRV